MPNKEKLLINEFLLGLPLSPHTRRALAMEGVDSMFKLAYPSQAELLRVPGIGWKAWLEIDAVRTHLREANCPEFTAAHAAAEAARDEAEMKAKAQEEQRALRRAWRITPA